MAVSEETIQALADAVAGWRLQECVYISFFCLYVYYVLTTMAEDVSIILPQKWNRGKTLHMTIRYGLIVFISVQLISGYRNYFLISPNACKALFIVWNFFNFVVKLTCNFTLGICLGALLQTNPLYLAAIVILSCGVTLVNAVISVVSTIQYPAEPISPLDAELGYPCVVPSGEQWSALTIAYTGRDVRAYVNLVTTTLLSLMGIITLAVRYRGQGGRLIQVLRRDGGVYYLSLLTIRLAEAIVRTPTVVSVSALDGSPAYLLIDATNVIIIPILAQRLLTNMRKVDYTGSQPVASKLLFAPAMPGSEDELKSDINAFEMAGEQSYLHNGGAVDRESHSGKTGKGSNDV